MKTESKTHINEVVERTKEARRNAGVRTQLEMANRLGIDRDRYASYETRRIIAKELISPFCKITGVSEKWLLTGAGEKTAPSSERTIERDESWALLIDKLDKRPAIKQKIKDFALFLLLDDEK